MFNIEIDRKKWGKMIDSWMKTRSNYYSYKMRSEFIESDSRYNLLTMVSFKTRPIFQVGNKW